MNPYYTLGGFIPPGQSFPANPEYHASTAIVMSIIVDNYDKKSVDPVDIKGLAKAMAWEKRYLSILLVFYLLIYLDLNNKGFATPFITYSFKKTSKLHLFFSIHKIIIMISYFSKIVYILKFSEFLTYFLQLILTQNFYFYRHFL